MCCLEGEGPAHELKEGIKGARRASPVNKTPGGAQRATPVERKTSSDPLAVQSTFPVHATRRPVGEVDRLPDPSSLPPPRCSSWIGRPPVRWTGAQGDFRLLSDNGQGADGQRSGNETFFGCPKAGFLAFLIFFGARRLFGYNPDLPSYYLLVVAQAWAVWPCAQTQSEDFETTESRESTGASEGSPGI